MSTTLEDKDVSKTGQLIRNDIETECDKQKVLPANQHMTTVLLPPQEIVLDELDGLSSAGNDQHGVSNDSVYLHKDNSSMEETSGTLGETSGTLAEQEHEKEVLCKVTDGQPVQLEDGTMAFLHTTAREGAQPIQLEDGSTAYISPAPSDASFMSQGTAHVQDDGNLGSKSEEAVNSMRKECMVTDNGSGVVKFTMTPDRILQLGEKAYRCSFSGCGRLYSTQHHLKVHERSHTGDRPFRCEYEGCGKGFATGYGLKSHTRVHTGEKPYKCPEGQCSKAFKTSGDLQKHIRIHTGERPFKCPFEGCDRSFTTSNIRKVHIRTHTGEKPYVCTHDGCNRTFASATNYKNHIRIHTGEKPYVCTVDGCQKRFTEYSSLYKHHVVHTHQKPYVCNHCGKTYRQTSTLTMHKRTVHNDNTTPEMEAEFARQNEVREYSNHEEPQDGALVINTSESQQVTMVTGLPSSQAVTTLPVSRLQGAQVVTVSTGEQGEQIYVVTDPSQLLQLGLQVEQQPMAQDDPAEDGQSALSIVQSAEHAEEILQPLDQQ